MAESIKAGVRQFSQRPFFTALAVVLLAVGIGSNVLIFTFIDTLILKPLPVRNPGSLFLLQSVREQMVRPNVSFSYGQFEELRKRRDLFEGVTAEEAWGGQSAFPSSEPDGSVHLVMTQMLAPNYFEEMGVKALVGRVFTESDARPSTNIPALISYQFWQSHYGGQAGILGKIIRLKNFPFTIVGVLPRDFHSVDIERAPDIRLPISAAPYLLGKEVSDPRGEDWNFGFCVLLRLKPGVNPRVAPKLVANRLYDIGRREAIERNASSANPMKLDQLQELLGWFNEERFVLEPVGSGISRLRTQFTQALKLLMAGVIVLLIAVCANVAGLLMARGEERRKELAVRLSIGASRWQLLRQLMFENLCLAIPGGLLGLLLAYTLAPSLLRILPPVRSLDQFASPQILTITADLPSLLFAWFILLISVCLFGLIPAWRATRLDINSELKGTATLAPHSLASLIPVALQVMLSVLLLAAGGLMLHSYWNLEHLNPGFDRTHVLSFTLGLDHAGFTEAQAQSYQDELENRVLQLPGIRSVAFSTFGLMRGAGLKTTITRPGAPKSKNLFMNTTVVPITLTFFDTLGIPLLTGRYLTPGDLNTVPMPVVINRALADSLFPHTNPIGQLLVNGNDGSKPPREVVVGLVETAKFRRMQEPSPPTLYTVKKMSNDRLVLFVRSTGDPTPLIKPTESIIRKLNSSVPIVEQALLEQEVQNTLWQERLVARLASFFSLIALLLAGLGLYGALAFSVARRKRELGIRIAIGAQIHHVLATVCGRMSLAVGFGLAAGLLIASFALRFTKQFLFDVQTLDTLSFGIAAAVVMLSSCLSAWLPCRRAIRTDAATALRGD